MVARVDLGLNAIEVEVEVEVEGTPAGDSPRRTLPVEGAGPTT